MSVTCVYLLRQAMSDEERFAATSSSMVERLKNLDDADTWLKFFNTYGKLIYSVARKAGL